jgi:hypothetical protein
MAPGSLPPATTAIGAHRLLHMLHALLISREFEAEASPCHQIDVTLFRASSKTMQNLFVSFMVLLLPTLIITIITFTLILNSWSDNTLAGNDIGLIG